VRLALIITSAVALVSVGAGCGGDESSSQGTTATTTEETTATAVETTTTGATTGEDDGTGNAANGEQIFASAGCAGCHTLAAAGSSGSIGPNLDDASPSFDKVVERVTEGQGAMPSFADQLTEQEIRDVAAYVSSSTRD
jgi:mono/diheme cytochrome c family protein